MGEAARRKAMGPKSNPNESIDRGPWLHGTNVRFDSWQVPPPLEANDPFNVPHTAVFLTKHADFAQDAGSFTCEAMLTPDAKVLVPESDESDMLRRRLKKHPVGGRCAWLRDETTWRASWTSGDIMRFAAEERHILEIVSRMTKLHRQRQPELPHDFVSQVVQHNITRGWIEEIVKTARALGFEAIQGNEIDRHAGAVPIARPWLAVCTATALTAPVWR